MERTGHWVLPGNPMTPADLLVEVGDATFSLHRIVMVEKSEFFRRRLKDSGHGDGKAGTITLSSLPGGAKTFDKVAKFCYGVGFDITAHDVAPLRCAAEYLDMTAGDSDGGLVEMTETFLAQTALRSLSGAVAVLRSCEGLSPAAEELGIVRRCVDAIGLKVCNEAMFPTRSPLEWWAEELAALTPADFQLVLSALRSRGAAAKIITTTVMVYAEKALSTPSSAVTEAFIAILPPERDVPLPVAFLCRLLNAAVSAAASPTSLHAVERRISAVLDQATAEDLLSITLDSSGQHVGDLDSFRRIVAGFVERESGGDGLLTSAAMQKVERVVDVVAAEIATDEELAVSKFVAIAGAIPKSARGSDDELYRAVDIYLKAHPRLDEIQREKVCSVMDPLKLSYDARLHASQNKRLPLQAALTALYYDNLKLRSGVSAVAPAAPRQRKGELQTDLSLVRENEALRSELARMRTYVSQLEHGGGGGGGSSSQATKKTRSFFSSVTKTLGRLNPFKAGVSKDTASIADAAETSKPAAKPRRRRFSIS